VGPRGRLASSVLFVDDILRALKACPRDLWRLAYVCCFAAQRKDAPVIHSPACDIQPCLYSGKCAIMVEAVTVRRDRIRPVLGICPMRSPYKLFEIKILPASD